jgi:hypothetical protein
LERLEIIDPELSGRVAGILSAKRGRITGEVAALLEEEALWAMAKDIELGYLVAEGVARLAGEASPARLARYREMIRYVGEKGVNLGRMLARYWVPVLRFGDDDLVARFGRVATVMRKKGEYTLKKPFDYLSSLLEDGRHATAAAFLGLLHDIFSRDLPYKDCLYLARAVPETVAGLPDSRRNWQISQLRRVVRAEVQLVRPFMAALAEKLCRLSEDGLRRFVTRGLDAFERSGDEGLRFLTLASKQGIDAYDSLLVAVSLGEVRSQLNRYLKARTGMGISVRPMSSLPGSATAGLPAPSMVLSNGRWIYLADEISLFSDRTENQRLYKCLARLESAHYEFGSFAFDLERTLEELGLSPAAGEGGRSDLERFFGIFPDPGLARDLFTVFEHGRLRRILEKVYPGMVRSAFPLLIREARRVMPGGRGAALLMGLYRRIALGEGPDADPPGAREAAAMVLRRFEGRITPASDVNTVGAFVYEIYPEIRRRLDDDPPGSLSPPFGRRLRPDLHFAAHRDADQIAGRIQARLKARGIKVYRQDLRQRLILQQGALRAKDLQDLMADVRPADGRAAATADARSGVASELAAEVLAEVLGEKALALEGSDDGGDPVFWYREWDSRLGDYLNDHVRVVERTLAGASSGFYEGVLGARYGLVRNIRRAFELLKPEGLILLRRWTEGDAFDHRALIDFAVDRKAGIMPSDRLYTKRIKQQRDVAVLLLVDLSHSTSNRVYGATATVLDLEKEAIVLFSEALQVVGDDFAVAGFSGTGRLGVDYFRVKDFERPVDDVVRGRIGALSPQRSTRMGAAIRHAATQLASAAARVRLLIILGDGFPNDTGYKREYAIADTRKAIAEARTKGIHARAITVNIIGDERLDDLYGSLHHNVISDVRELPDKLLRIYSALTR